MKPLLSIIGYIAFLISVLFVIPNHFSEGNRRPQIIGSEYVVKMVIDHESNRCTVTYPIEYGVTLQYVPSDVKFAGLWDSSLQEVSLNRVSGMDVDTVAHESSHIVDTIMEIWAFDDQHYEAYLVGRMTGCLWMLVEEDKK